MEIENQEKFFHKNLTKLETQMPYICAYNGASEFQVFLENTQKERSQGESIQVGLCEINICNNKCLIACHEQKELIATVIQSKGLSILMKTLMSTYKNSVKEHQQN